MDVHGKWTRNVLQQHKNVGHCCSVLKNLKLKANLSCYATIVGSFSCDDKSSIVITTIFAFCFLNSFGGHAKRKNKFIDAMFGIWSCTVSIYYTSYFRSNPHSPSLARSFAHGLVCHITFIIIPSNSHSHTSYSFILLIFSFDVSNIIVKCNAVQMCTYVRAQRDTKPVNNVKCSL